VATTARWSGDLTIAEDAVQEACAHALRVWPSEGLPTNPGAGLTTVARNRALDRMRRESLRPGKEFAAVYEEVTARSGALHPVRDDELPRRRRRSIRGRGRASRAHSALAALT
jgi:predicted RNA polymerase sigma factor